MNPGLRLRGGGTRRSLEAIDRIVKSSHRQQQQQGSVEVEPLNVVLSKWKEEFLHTPNETLHPRQVLEKVDEWKSLLQFGGQGNDGYRLHNMVPNAKSYTLILEAAAGNVKDKQSQKNDIVFADRLLERLLEDSKTSFGVQPTTAGFAAVMSGWAKLSDWKNEIPPPSAKVEEWIQHLQELHEEGWPDLEPNIVIYNILLKSYMKEGNISKIEETLQRMIRQEIPGVSPDTISYSTLLSAYAKKGTPDSAVSAESLLNQMLELYENGVESAKPNVVSVTNVVKCFAELGQGEEAEKLLQKFQDMYQNTLDPEFKPDVMLYNTVLLSWTRSGQPGEAQALLDFMCSEYQDFGWKADDDDSGLPVIKPDARSFNIVLSAWASIGDAERAESILTRMHELYVVGELDTKPTIVSYNTVLAAYSKLAAKMNGNKRHRKEKTNQSCVPLDRAEAILNHMEELHAMGDDTVKPNQTTWNTLIDVCAKSGEVGKAEEFLERFARDRSDAPGIRTWNTLLAACMARGDVVHSRRIWSRMKETKVDLDIISYNTLINCYLRHSQNRSKGGKKEGGKYGMTKVQEGEGVEKIIRELRQDPNVVANHITHLAIVRFWLSRNDPEKAELFLLQTIKDYLNDSAKDHPTILPEKNLFHQTILAWSPQKAPKRAEALLLKMAELAENNGLDLRPDLETYNSLLHCWAKSEKPESGERAEAILREMQALSQSGDKVTPNIYSYNHTLNALANSGDPTATTRADSLILEMILKGVMPDVVSYGTWLKVISLSEDKDKKRRVKDVAKMMKIHNFEPTKYLLQRMRDLSEG